MTSAARTFLALACVLLVTLVLAPATIVAATADASVEFPSVDVSGGGDGGVVDSLASHPGDPAWLASFTHLARQVIRLPFVPASSARARALVAHYRAGPHGHTVDWAHRFGKLFVDHWESRSFPDALALMRTRPWFREKDHPTAAAVAMRSAEEVEQQLVAGDASSAAYDDSDEYDDRPKLFRASLLHLLAGRAFADALEDVLAYLPQRARQEALEAGCALAATFNFDQATPLHLLALYAPDAAGTPALVGATSADNVAAARVLLASGANLTAVCEPHQLVLTPVVFAAERGQLALMRYLLGERLPSAYFLRPSDVTYASSEEQLAYDEWALHREGIIAREQREVASGARVHNETDWREYMRWYDSHRPRTHAQREAEQFEAALWQALQLAVVSNRTQVVQLILDGPTSSAASSSAAATAAAAAAADSTEAVDLYAGYKMKSRLNDRAHDGQGDTVVQGAVVHGLLEMTRLLLRHGADPAMVSHDRLTLHALAIKYHRFDISGFLETFLREERPPVRMRRDPSQGTWTEEDQRRAQFRGPNDQKGKKKNSKEGKGEKQGKKKGAKKDEKKKKKHKRVDPNAATAASTATSTPTEANTVAAAAAGAHDEL